MVRRNTTVRDRARAILRRAGGPCHICGGEIDYSLPTYDPGSFVVDHVIPLARGGSDALSNKKPSHRACNRAKGAKPHADIIKRSGSLSRPGTTP
ncbi:HNH endonuclease [Georgenia sp. Z1344]|uniref:HNH endonuclease n=1 Tax=Georgenia sp. Z1344 TaxID=3416706 RepID=UPI003CF1F15D